ncbi:MAG: protein-L-isoaspartate(D-aspartate) O-methyltransferase [Proteobacteria bacterium]|nr:protein-L-isoaspartate(D-aspartate) O-methyltransferase [Pseudomonadota bacterium]
MMQAGVGMTSARTRQRLIDRLREQGIEDEAVLSVLFDTPRHLFLDEALRHRAYENTPLSIGHQQTISQPYIVALMTQLAKASAPGVRRVLDIGTGCGYQAAVLSQLVDWVFTVERIEALSFSARERLQTLGYKNISYLCGDGYQGWPRKAPFDAIIVAAAPPAVPEALKQQLAVGGRLVIPVGDDENQALRLIRRTRGGFDEEIREAVKFVPLVDT